MTPTMVYRAGSMVKHLGESYDYKVIDADDIDAVAQAKANGWGEPMPAKPSDDIDALRDKAKALGITVHHKMSAATLQAKIDEAGA